MYDQATDAPAGLEEIRCPHCGGLNRVGAQWCGQCLERFVPPKPLGSQGGRAGGAPPPPPPPPPPTMQPEAALSELSQIDAALAAPAAPAASPTTGARGASSGADDQAFLVGSDGITWACKHCETLNSIDSDDCSSCGMPFADLLRPPVESKPKRDPNTVALISLFWPGAGHGYIGDWGQAIARAVVYLWVIVVTAVSFGQSGFGLMTMLFGAVSFGLWTVSAHDAYQEASDAAGKVILRPKYFLWLVLGILVALMGMLLIEGLQANAASR